MVENCQYAVVGKNMIRIRSNPEINPSWFRLRVGLRFGMSGLISQDPVFYGLHAS